MILHHKTPTVAIASDHGGYTMKEAISRYLHEKGYLVVNHGCLEQDSSVDYPDYAKKVCDMVAEGGAKFGVLVCGTGIGMSIAANRNPKIRAGLCKDMETARLTREHNDANVLCMGARVTDSDYIEAIVDTFMKSKFQGGRHQKRVEKL